MSGKTIGYLNVIIGADAKGAVKGINSVEKALVNFEAKVTSIPRALSGATLGIVSQIEDIVKGAMKAFGGAAQLVPGGESWAKQIGLLDWEQWEESAGRGVDSMKQIAKLSQFHGVTPEFGQALMFKAGDAGTAAKMLDRVAMAQAKLLAGDKSTADALRPFLDLEKFANGDTASGIRQIADALRDLKTHAHRLGLADALGMKKDAGSLLELLGSGSLGIDKTLALLKETGAASGGTTNASARVAAMLENKDKAEQLGLDTPRGQIDLALRLNKSMFNDGKIGYGEFFANERNLKPWSPLGVLTGAANLDPLKAARQLIEAADHGELTKSGTLTSTFKDELAAAKEEEFTKRMDAAHDKWKHTNESLIDSIMSVGERYEQQLEIVARSGLTAEQQLRAADRAFAQSFGVDAALASARQTLMTPDRGASLASSGSQEFFAALDAVASGPKSDPDRAAMLDLAQKNLHEQENARRQREDMIRALRERGAPVGNIPN